MRLDKFSQPIFQDQDIFNLIYENDPEVLAGLIADPSAEITKLIENSNLSINTTDQIDYSISQEEFDHAYQNKWFMPDEYKNMDIEGFLVDACPKENYQRLVDELVEYQDRNMLDLLRWMKYFVDTCRANNIVWGVGRGSSVASYVLFLIGVHKINSITYNLDWREFLR